MAIRKSTAHPMAARAIEITAKDHKCRDLVIVDRIDTTHPTTPTKSVQHFTMVSAASRSVPRTPGWTSCALDLWPICKR